MVNLRRGLLIHFLIGSYFIVIFTYTIILAVLQSVIIWSCHLEVVPEIACML